MPDIEVNDLASVGIINDIASYQLPPEAFTSLLNVRLTRDGIERGPDWTSVFSPTVAPYFIFPIRSPVDEFWWVYLSLTKAKVWDGSSENDITNSGGDYTTGDGRDWNGTRFGGIPIFNNGADVPQYWSALDTGTPLADLTNWPAALRAKVLRTFGPYLVAFNLTESGTNYPHAVQWSHPADPGSLPSSWDITDETVDAGRVDLPDVDSGVIRDALMLRGVMMIYKDASTWTMRRIGGQYIFQFDPLFASSGILAPRCVALTGDSRFHFAATSDDIVVHDGVQSPVSVVDKRMRRTVFNRIDATNYRNSFVFCYPAKREMWFCYPENGETVPTRALVWSYGAGGALGVCYEQEVNFQAAASGDIATAGESWDSDSDTWDSDTTAWDVSDKNQLVVGNPAATKMYKLDSGDLTRDGVAFNATASREGLAIFGRRRSGEPLVDMTVRKFVRRMWVRGEGGPIRIRVGVQDTTTGSISWSSYMTFDPSSQQFVDFHRSGKLVAVEFSTTASVAWRVNSYRVELTKAGRF